MLVAIFYPLLDGGFAQIAEIMQALRHGTSQTRAGQVATVPSGSGVVSAAELDITEVPTEHVIEKQ